MRLTLIGTIKKPASTLLHSFSARTLLLSALFLLGRLNSGAAEIGLVKIFVPSKVKFATWTSEESKEGLVGSINKLFFRGFEKERHSFYRTDEVIERLSFKTDDPFNTKEKAEDVWIRLGGETGLAHLLTIRIESISQKNASSGSILNNLGKPASETNVEYSFEYYNTATKSITRFAKQKSQFLGPYFGTTNSDELSGDPTAKAIMIRTENQKRMDCIAMALWEGMKIRILPLLEL